MIVRGCCAALAAAALLLVTGCDTTVQETLGIGKRQPDEFQIVRRQPLIIPPDASLRPPRPGERGPAEVSSSAQARALLTGETSPDDTSSTGERALLAQATTPADPDIRRKLLEENTELATIDDSRFLMILNWQRRRMTPQGEPIDAAAEAARLRGEGIAVPGPATQLTGSTPLTDTSGS
jgi:hypothetical protein